MTGGEGVNGYRHISLWFDDLATGVQPTARPPLEGDTTADVVIVGAGFTGLWTAYYLHRQAPGLDIVVVESEVAGFGASGRNGGWCSALFPAPWHRVAAQHGEEAALSFAAAMRETVGEVLRVCRDEDIDAHAVKGGTVTVARTAVQLDRARAYAADSARWHDEVELLDAAGVSQHVRMSGALGGTWTPHCAALQPARLVRGLADVVERRGVRIFEHTRATGITPGEVQTTGGSVRARHVIRATEGFTARLPGARREVAPVYSLMVATEPLPDRVWQEIGLQQRQTFSDFRHLIIYGQRTSDGRLAFGGRGAPYHFGSALQPRFDRDDRTHRALTRLLGELFPALQGTAITHRWGGPLAIPRDWHASVGLDRSTGLGWAGGYVGDGVGSSNLAGRTLAELITGDRTGMSTSTSSAITRLPWVGHRSPRWEPEPLRWFGVNTGLRAMSLADLEERVTRRSSASARVFGRLTGH